MRRCAAPQGCKQVQNPEVGALGSTPSSGLGALGSTPSWEACNLQIAAAAAEAHPYYEEYLDNFKQGGKLPDK